MQGSSFDEADDVDDLELFDCLTFGLHIAIQTTVPLEHSSPQPAINNQ